MELTAGRSISQNEKSLCFQCLLHDRIKDLRSYRAQGLGDLFDKTTFTIFEHSMHIVKCLSRIHKYECFYLPLAYG